jgi:hypothetical protein
MKHQGNKKRKVVVEEEIVEEEALVLLTNPPGSICGRVVVMFPTPLQYVIQR